MFFSRPVYDGRFLGSFSKKEFTALVILFNLIVFALLIILVNEYYFYWAISDEVNHREMKGMKCSMT